MTNEERKKLFEEIVLVDRTYLERFILTLCRDPGIAEDIM